MTDAHSRASHLAELAGVTLGKPVAVSEVLDEAAVYFGEDYLDGLGLGFNRRFGLYPEQFTVTVQVEVTYRIR